MSTDWELGTGETERRVHIVIRGALSAICSPSTALHHKRLDPTRPLLDQVTCEHCRRAGRGWLDAERRKQLAAVKEMGARVRQ